MEGYVKEFGIKGYGFILVPGDPEDYFVHYKDVESTGSFRTLQRGQKVEFVCQKTAKGLRAINVKAIE